MQEMTQKKPDWVEIGLFILQVAKAKSWRQMSPTFKDWLETFAKHVESTRASLFKYRAGVKIGLELRGLKLTDDESEIVKAFSKTKSDIIEMLAKIIPLVPGDVAQKLVDDVFSGALSRAKVKDMLRLYKQSVDAGGRANHIDERAAIIATLVSAGPTWLHENENVSTYKFVANLQYVAIDGYVVLIDAALAIKRKEKDNTSLEIHGLTLSRGKDHLSHLKPRLSYCDYHWILFGDVVDWDAADLPSVGVLQANDGKVTLLRKAKEVGHRLDVALTAHAFLGAVL
ncbi:hypothetical protein [Rhodoferax sp.]|uniref:hypothetical protein n=1 Tax=Rhodoferax sp. TaxID=50421 RepID=UPI0025DFC836|nr:hypothetical protein [Rhodoferax sp.]